jgi:hypothetical protein
MIPLKYNGTTFHIPTSWQEVTLGDFLHWVQHRTWPLPCQVDELDARSIVLLGTALSFLQEVPDWSLLPFEPIDITTYSYGQKVDALHYYGQYANDLHGAIPVLLAIYRQRRAYNFAKVEGHQAEVLGSKAVQSYPRALSILRQLEAVENELTNSLKKVPYDPPEIESCFKDLQQWGAYAVVDSLAHGDKTKHDFFFNLPVAEVHTMIRYDNARAYCQYQAQQVVKAKANRK